MYKLFLHHSEMASEGKAATETKKATKPRLTKAAKELQKYLDESPRIQKEFEANSLMRVINKVEYRHINFVSDKSNPDLLVKYKVTEISLNWVDWCAFEFKFGMDLVNSLNSGLLKDELTRMKYRYSEPAMTDGRDQSLPLYLVIVNEWDWVWEKLENRRGNWVEVKVRKAKIPQIDLERANTIATNLNIRVKYCDIPQTFSKNVFDLIRTPPSEVDLGQRFVIKSSGSDWNNALQSYHGVSKNVANKIEGYWANMLLFTQWKNDDVYTFEAKLKTCFTTSNGRFMKANMEKFLKKVSGK